MNHKLTPSTIVLLTIPPLLWAGNAIVGRLVRDAVSPMTLNLLRWSIALLILVPVGRAAFRPGSGLLSGWRRFAVLGLLGIGLYNSLLYLALQTSTPINVTLVASSLPLWMLVVGWAFYGAQVGRKQAIGALLSISGVLLVLCRGEWSQLLAMRLVAGDVYMILATIAWSFYSWMLMQPKDPPRLRADWSAFLLAQVAYGVMWSGMFSAGEWAAGAAHIDWSWTVVAALLYVAIGPAIIALQCWRAGVQRAGPNVGAFFNNLTPLFAALMSSAFLGELPHLYHMAAFALIVGGIFFSTRR
ncbi:MAG: DMT family transporter [Telluria sp.]|nr:DMT family transporter [Telluria sp.]